MTAKTKDRTAPGWTILVFGSGSENREVVLDYLRLYYYSLDIIL